MKATILIITLLFSSFLIAQSKFSMGIGIGQFSLKKDLGTSYDGFISYNIYKDIAINFVGAHAAMKSNQGSIDYNINKYALLVSYDFAKTEKSKLESVFGFSYINFDQKLLLDKNNGLGIDLGIQTTFLLKSKLNLGLKIISTYSYFAPGGIINVGTFVKYNF